MGATIEDETVSGFDWKRDLTANSDDDKKEYLADVSSLTNTSGLRPAARAGHQAGE